MSEDDSVESIANDLEKNISSPGYVSMKEIIERLRAMRKRFPFAKLIAAADREASKLTLGASDVPQGSAIVIPLAEGKPVHGVVVSNATLHGWALSRNVLTVECPDCAFVMGADHTEESAGIGGLGGVGGLGEGEPYFRCPNCCTTERTEVVELKEAAAAYLESASSCVAEGHYYNKRVDVDDARLRKAIAFFNLPALGEVVLDGDEDGDEDGDDDTEERLPCVSGETSEGIQFRGQMDPNMSEESKAALAGVMKAAYEKIKPHVDKGTHALLVYEKAIHDAWEAEREGGMPYSVTSDAERAGAQANATAAREKLLEYVTHPLLVSSSGSEDDRERIAFLDESCMRQQKELAALRASAASLAGQRTDLEASNRLLRLEAEEVSRALAKAEKGVLDGHGYEWPKFEEATAVRILGRSSPMSDTDVPICAGDSIVDVAKAIAKRLKHLRESPTR